MMTTQNVEQPRTELAWHQLHAVELRRRAAQLRDQAEQARDHAFRAIKTTEVRRLKRSRTREQEEFAHEQERGTEELAAYITGLRREQEMLQAEAALQQDWFREQVLAMLDQGWKREDLAEIGFGGEFLADLGLLDHPSLQPG
ncbi:MAG TPA: hypothetical protein VK358_08350 [Longimicrobium sp.]|nr:hypothetical protein [Longimicrobium sp.]